MKTRIRLAVLSVVLLLTASSLAHHRNQSMPGMKSPSPSPSASPATANGTSAGDAQPAPPPQTQTNMPETEMAPVSKVTPLVMSGGWMAVRIGGSDSKFMLIGQMGSGTSWQPVSTSTYMVDKMKGDWLVMFHYNLFVGVNHQGGPRRGTKAESSNWFMPMAFHRLGRGTLELRAMFSAEPFSFPPGGSPLLFQTGETYKGQ